MDEVDMRCLLLALLAAGNQGRDDDETQLWPGEIQKGMHVRCVSCSHGAGVVSIGDVGVVQSRDQDGDYIVDFPKRDRWYGRPSDLVIDDEAEKVRPGALVSIKNSVTNPAFQWGSFKPGMHGIVVKVEHDGKVKVQCGFGSSEDPNGGLWNSQLQELRVVDDGSFKGSFKGKWSGKLQLGQAVSVPSSLDSPSTGWGKLKRHEIGYVRWFSEEDNVYVCDFPSVDGWKGRAGDLEVDPTATLIRPGKRVRVRGGITPTYQWGSVTSSSVGTVLSCSHDGKVVIVKFPEDSKWYCTLADLETIDSPRTVEAPTAVPVTPRAGDAPIVWAETSDKFAIGSTVIVTGLSSSVQFNGKTAEVVDKVDKRYKVKIKLSDNKEVLVNVKEANLTPPEQTYKDGTFVKLCNLQKRPELNGTIARIIGIDSSTGRYIVSINNSSTVKVFPSSFQVLEEVGDVE